jgi:PAS domain S-box-containing protein
MAAVHPEDRARVDAGQRAATAGEARLDLEHRIVRPDGTVRAVHELGDLTRDAAGRPTHLSGTVQDVTERVQAEAELRERDEAFSAAFRASPMAMVITTLESRYVEVNQAYCDLTGLSREELLGRTVMELGLLGHAARDEVVGTIERAGGTLGGLEFQLNHRDGTPRNVIAGVTEITLHGVRHRLSTALDVTEQRRAECALRNSEVRYRRLFETAKDGIVILDATTGKVIDANPHLATILGVSVEQFAGKAIWEVAFFREVVGDAATFEKLREKEYLRFPHLPLETAAGARIEVEFISSVYEVNGRKVIQCSLHDVTAQRQAELALRQLNTTLEQRVIERTAQLEAANTELAAHATAISHDLRVAEASDRLKSAFLATMSHELRTPLNSIIGFTGIVLKGMAGPLNAEQTKQLGMVRGSARHLLELINDVLDLSKIEAGQLEVRAEPFDLWASIERVVASVSPQAERKALAMTAMLPPELGEMISDRRRVEQILINLINNAIKFTDHGSVTLTVELLAGSQPSVCFRVTDTGIGIEPDELATLFQPFRQIDSGPARQSEGTGLGLAICRRLATLLDGEISARSEPERGSEFTVTLPLQKIP